MISKELRNIYFDPAFIYGSWDNRKVKRIANINKAIEACNKAGFLCLPVSERDFEKTQIEVLNRSIGKSLKSLHKGAYIAIYYLVSNGLAELED